MVNKAFPLNFLVRQPSASEVITSLFGKLELGERQHLAVDIIHRLNRCFPLLDLFSFLLSYTPSDRFIRLQLVARILGSGYCLVLLVRDSTG